MITQSSGSIIRRTGFLTVGKILQSLMSFFATIYMAHVLGPTDFGILGFTAAVTSYFGLASTLGVPTLATREISQVNDTASSSFSKEGQIVGDVVFLTGGLALISYALLWMLTPIFALTPRLQAILLISGLQVLINALSPQWAFAGIQRMEFNASANILGTIIRVGLVFLVIHGPNNLEEVPMLAVFGTLTTVVAEWWLFQRIRSVRWSLSWPRMWSIFHRSLPMTTASAMMQIYNTIDTIFLGYWDGLGVVGYYNAAYKLVLFLQSFTTVYNHVVFPLATRLFLVDKSRLKAQLSLSLSATTLITLPTILGGTWLASPIIRTIYGYRFEAADPVLQILLWTWGISLTTLHYGPVLIACNQERRFAQGIVLGSAVNMVANLVAIPLLGDIGAALSILLTEVAILGYMMHHMTRLVGWYGPSVRTVLGGVFSCGVMLMGLDLFGRRMDLGESIGFGTVLYGTTLLVSRTITLRQVKRTLEILAPRSWVTPPRL